VTDREYEGFHGPVSSFTMTQSTYLLNDRTGSYVEGPSATTQAETFNPDGRVKQAKQFSNGLENGSIIREYSEDELEARDISVNSDGQREDHKLLADEQVSVSASRIHFDETLEEGTKGTKNYDTCKFNDTGQRTECFIPVQGARYVMKYDENDRETDWLVYTGDVLRGKTHFTYEENEYGDWTVQHATFWNSTKSDLGFIPLGETYRNISYFGAAHE
jgi:antitoxin component YwqK of YwqJK toxin-antitoxin module